MSILGSTRLTRQLEVATRSAVASSVLVVVRRVHGGSGRGDLLYQNPDARRHTKRVLGTQSGLRHSSQATAPESGQLHYRKLMLHSAPRGALKGMGMYCNDICNWNYLITSLQRCAELAIHADLWGKLCEFESKGNCGVSASVTEHELQHIHEGQNIYRYELHQRLPLLEESIGGAGLTDLVGLFRSARRAWVRFTTSHTPSSVISEVATADVQPPSSAVLLQLGSRMACRDTTPGRNQIFDISERVTRLIGEAVRRIREELRCFDVTEQCSVEGSAVRRTSSRRLAKREELSECAEGVLKWHGLVP